MLNLTDGSRFAFYLSHEAYYAKACGYLDKPEIMVTRNFPDGGCVWEFSVRKIRDIGVTVGMFEDSWGAFAQIPEFFAALAADNPRTVGFHDATKRVSPYPESLDALKHPCAYCGRDPLKWCVNPQGSPTARLHRTRFVASGWCS